MTKRLVVGSSVASFIVGGTVFFLVGFFAPNRSSLSGEDQIKIQLAEKLLSDSFRDDEAVDDIVNVDADRIMDFLSNLSSSPHLSGSQRDEELVQIMIDSWRQDGLDRVYRNSYEVLLDYPDKQFPNLITLTAGNGKVLFTSNVKEIPLHKDDDFEELVDAFLAYSPAGTVEGVPVYVNYAREEDFGLLADKNGGFFTDVKERLCLARYGEIFRGNMASNAHKHGCLGLIIYSDPQEVTLDGVDSGHLYPNTVSLPKYGIQRGSLLLTDGDPETPNRPSLPGVYKNPREELRDLFPSISCQPIGYGDAKVILSYMGGKKAPQQWLGGIPDVVYNLGGRFIDNYVDAKLTLQVHNKLERKNVTNVIGILKGSVEPDRYVILGNHRDAWGFGALDPSSGTAQMMEVVKVLGEKVKNEGWRPRRTLVFASWDAEEYALSGSREFVEDFSLKLQDRAVIYINVDVCGGGDIFSPIASPTVMKKTVQSTKHVTNPRNRSQTYYDFWMEWLDHPHTEVDDLVHLPGAGSDHASFIFYSGIPIIYLTFQPDLKKDPSLRYGYPTYHTGYETFHLVKELYKDPEAKHVLGLCSQLSLRLAREYADSLLLDFDLDGYPRLFNRTVIAFDKNGVWHKLDELGVEYAAFLNSVKEFGEAIFRWKDYLAAQDWMNDPMVAKHLNDQMMKLDRAFLLPMMLPTNGIYRHGMIAPASSDMYGGGAFPGIPGLLDGIDVLTEEEKKERIVQLKIHISELMIAIHRAADFINEVDII